MTVAYRRTVRTLGDDLDVALATAEQLARYRPTDEQGRIMKALNAVQLDRWIRATSEALHPCASS